MATKITYTDKVKSVDIPNPAEEKFRADDANEIKVVVNSNADELNSLDGTNIELIKGGGIFVDTAITDLYASKVDSVNGNTDNNIILDGTNIELINGGGIVIDTAITDLYASKVNSVNGDTSNAIVLDGNDIDWDNNSGITVKTKIDLLDGAVLNNMLTKVELGGDIGGNVSNPTINNGAITNAKLSNIPTNRIKGRATSGNGEVEDLTVPQTKQMLALDNVDNTSDLNKPISTATATALNILDLDITTLYADKISKNVGTTYTTNALTTVTQSEYDALTPDSSTIYFIV